MSSAAQTLNDCPPFAGDAEGAQWYAIQTRPRHEKKVVAELAEKGVCSYLPLLAQVHRWSDRRKIVHTPLFSCYAFVNAVLTAEARCSMLQIWGVLGFVGPQRRAVPIPGDQIESVRRLLNQVGAEPHPFLKVGQRVRVRGGCLDGIEGILTSRQRDKFLVISVDAIQRSLSVSLEGYDVVPI
jgi:transcription termination/antitermination protein NusG